MYSAYTTPLLTRSSVCVSRRVFILGPSHHHSTRICELTALDTYATPLSPLIIDRAVVTALRSSKHFSDMSTEVDEDEHSIEMHLPYVAHVMSGHNFTIVPILVGALSSTMERNIADALKPYWSDSTNLFVISSDFCHWGQRFRYQPYDRKFASISESIRALDHRGMALIEAVDVNGFIAYQQETSNTICGRHPIGVLLALLDADKSNNEWIVKFVRYAQSSACTKMSDSSVSYASAIIYKKTDAD